MVNQFFHMLYYRHVYRKIGANSLLNLCRVRNSRNWVSFHQFFANFSTPITNDESSTQTQEEMPSSKITEVSRCSI